MSTLLKNQSSAPKQQSQGFAQNYVPDLSAFMSLCDANYARLMQLLPELEGKDKRCFGLSRSQHDIGVISLSVVERCKYTTMLNITQEQESQEQEIGLDLLPTTYMQVRLYHDASMAEVMSYQGIGNLKANYQYPNKHMYQKDEKALCNEFLADWLSYCLKFGYSLDVIVESETVSDIKSGVDELKEGFAS